MSHDEAFPPGFETAPTGKQPHQYYVMLALLIPLLATVTDFFVTTFMQGLIIGGVTVVVTSLLVFMDALQFDTSDPNGKKQTSPAVMLIGGLLLWVAFFPLSFYRRSHFAKPNLTLWAVLVTIIFMVTPFVFAYLVPAGLPTCDSAEVQDLIKQLVKQSPVGPTVTRIDGYQQLSFDEAKQMRVGQCQLHTPQGVRPLKYQVEWQGQDRTHFYVRTLVELPRCTDKEAKDLLEQVVKGIELGKGLTSIEGHQELSFDAQQEVRRCQCTVVTPQGKVIVAYTISWQNKDQAMFQILIPNVNPGT